MLACDWGIEKKSDSQKRNKKYLNLKQIIYIICQGSTLRTWLSKINALHDHLESAFPRGMIKPVFWCEDDEDIEGSIILHYFSKRGT